MENSNITQINTTCPWCKAIKPMDLDTEAYNNWRRGMRIQNAFPNLRPDERERLMTGLCPECWNNTFEAMR